MHNSWKLLVLFSLRVWSWVFGVMDRRHPPDRLSYEGFFAGAVCIDGDWQQRLEAKVRLSISTLYGRRVLYRIFLGTVHSGLSNE